MRRNGYCDNIDPGACPVPSSASSAATTPAGCPASRRCPKRRWETYQPPQVTAADSATRVALHDKPLRPDRNLGGYVSPPPTMLTTMKSITALTKTAGSRACRTRPRSARSGSGWPG
ncbi:hypothetical protein E4K10_03445 [Streptomyces sp. T1317-0309]|nr:hypothetical protein E4K10_03445 [Streptomyces sp. T1317-0309]